MRPSTICLATFLATLVMVPSWAKSLKGQGPHRQLTPPSLLGGGKYSDEIKSEYDSECKGKLEKRFEGHAPQVRSARRGALDCSTLNRAGKDAATREFSVLGTAYTATRDNYQFFPASADSDASAAAAAADNVGGASPPVPCSDFGGRHAWTGSIVGSDGEMNGMVTFVWDDACSADVFYLTMDLPTVDDGKGGALSRSIASTPCTAAAAGGKKSCVWLADVAWAENTSSDEATVALDGRRLAARAMEAVPRRTTETDALDHDIALLQRLAEGDAEAHEQFHANGGRRLLDEDAVIMPSGRRLDTGSSVKVLFGYTASAQSAAGGSSQIGSKITAAISSANAVLSNSGAGFTIAGSWVYLSYTESSGTSGFNAALDALTNGNIPNVYYYRETYHYDLIQLLINNAASCGLGWLLPKASSAYAYHGYSVAHINCLDNFSHIHEIGHNMGANHDRAHTTSTTAWSYGYGYNYCGSTSKFRTVMSYQSSSCASQVRIPVFSTPTRTYGGIACGTSTLRNSDVLINTKYTVANFRQG